MILSKDGNVEVYVFDVLLKMIKWWVTDHSGIDISFFWFWNGCWLVFVSD